MQTFKMWSVYHIFLIILPVILALVLFLIFRKSSVLRRRIVGIILSALAVALLVWRNVEIYMSNGLEPEIIPFQICHFANFVLLFAFIFNSKTLYTFSFCFNLPAAWMALIFADSLENYISIWTARGIAYQFGHVLIVGLALYACLTGLIKANRKTLIRTIVLVLALYVISVPVNNLFNYWMPGHESNYFYSMKPEYGTPLEIFFNWGPEVTFLKMTFRPVYLLCTGALGIVVIVLFYILYKLLYRALGYRKRDRLAAKKNSLPDEQKISIL